VFHSLSEYPQWFVALCAVLAATVVLWVLVKLAKLALWAVVFVAVLALLAVAAGHFMH
jgi:hypothetical protein